MLKYQVRASPRSSSLQPHDAKCPSTSSSPQSHRTVISIREAAEASSSASSTASSTSSSFIGGSIRMRSNSLSSLSSIDSSDSSDWGYLRVFTGVIKADTDYKTLKISNQTTTQTVIEIVMNKFRLTCRDPNLFQLWMEIRTRHNGEEVKSLLHLDKNARPLELQRCHPQNMSRFILGMVPNAVLTRIHDYEICPMSNYKSVLISPRTTAQEAIHLLLQMCRNQEPSSRFRLLIVENGGEEEIADEAFLAGIYLSLAPAQKIVVRKVIF
ncbi:Protein W05B10.4 [Aphelenchoides avenae]|nr:Protein W05B10.4 [Aphelenchus avenae]